MIREELSKITNDADAYYYGKDGKHQDYHKAAEIYKRAVNEGSSYAMTMLAFMNEKGLGMKIDYNKAIELYGKASVSDPYAKLNLANMYDMGRGTNQDYCYANKLYLELAEGEECNAKYIAMSNLGRNYANGFGVEQSLSEAQHWIGKAEEGGHIFCAAMHDLGNLYLQYDENKAFECFTKALKADTSNVDTQYMFGNCCLFGRGTEVNPDEAKIHFDWIAEIGQGDDEVKVCLDIINQFNRVLQSVRSVKELFDNNENVKFAFIYLMILGKPENGYGYFIGTSLKIKLPISTLHGKNEFDKHFILKSEKTVGNGIKEFEFETGVAQQDRYLGKYPKKIINYFYNILSKSYSDISIDYVKDTDNAISIVVERK